MKNYEAYRKNLNFIDEYSRSSNAATGSKFDANANIETKNVTTLSCEVHKEADIGINRLRMMDKITALYGSDLANEYIRQLDSHEIYRHDETHPFFPYTYSAKETILVEVYGKRKLLSFELLYDLCNSEEFLVDELNDVYCKYPRVGDIKIFDKDGYTDITRLVKKKRHRDLVRIKTAFGEDLIVTDNHPLIVSDDIENTVSAVDSINENQYRIPLNIKFENKLEVDMVSDNPYVSQVTNEFHTSKATPFANYTTCNNKIVMDRDMGYVIGFFIGGGNYGMNAEGTTCLINFTQKERATLEHIADVIYKHTGVGSLIYYKEDKSNCWTMQARSIDLIYLFSNILGITSDAQHKTLPLNIFDYTKEFALGIIDGLIDSDGTVSSKDNTCSIWLSSRTAITQLSILARALGFSGGDTMQHAPFGNNKSYNTNYTMFGFQWKINGNQPKLNANKIQKIKDITDNTPKYSNGWAKITNLEVVEQSNFLEDNEYIYDITTSTHTFMCDGLLVHNCVSVTLYPFICDGLKNIGAPSTEPKNLNSFVGNFINLVFALSAQFAGACLYKDQNLHFNINGSSVVKTAKEFIAEQFKNKPITSFSNYQGTWEYVNVNGVQVAEDGEFVGVKKAYRRKYDEDIYIIKTKDGHSAKVSKDHKFKVLFRDRVLEIPANELVVGDTVFVNKDLSYIKNVDAHDFKDGWMKGFICGDGCIKEPNNIRLSINPEQRYYADIFNEYSKEIYNEQLTTVTYDKRGGGCYDYRKYNKEYYDAVTSGIIGTDTYTKHINIAEHSLDFLLGFIDGLFCADGSYTKGHSIHIQLTNYELANNVAEIVSLFSYKKPHIGIVEGIGNRKTAYSVYVNRLFLKYLEHTVKKKLFNNGNYLNDTRVNEVSHYGTHALKNCTGHKSTLFSCSNRDGGWNLDIIDSIETFKNDDEFVYEIETETHWYNCGGFITHNCATPEFLVYLNYFICLEYGDDYYLHTDEYVNSTSKRPKTLGKLIDDCFEQVVYSINEPAAARNFQSVFWNIAYFDKAYFESVFEDFVFPDGVAPQWESTSWLQKHFMKWFNAERKRNYLTFPVETVNLVYDKKTKKYLDEDWADFTSQMWAEGHSFFCYNSDSVDSLSSCCRLKSGITDNVFSYTLGAGGISTGSKAVITINVNRLVQDAFRQCQDGYGDFTEVLDANIRAQVSKIHKYLIAYNSILEDEQRDGLLPIYDAGYISLPKQYLTIGINGLVEGAEFLGIDISPNDRYFDYCKQILAPIQEENKKERTKDIMFNTEYVPAENLGVKNSIWDKKGGYASPRECYNSYFFNPEDDSLSVLDKIILHGNEVVQYLDGGSACHVNLEEHLTKEQYRKLLDVASKIGCSYFTFNIPNTVCNVCGHISKHMLNKCEECGSEDIDYITRVIGYAKRVSKYSEARQKEAGRRFYNAGL